MWIFYFLQGKMWMLKGKITVESDFLIPNNSLVFQIGNIYLFSQTSWTL